MRAGSKAPRYAAASWRLLRGAISKLLQSSTDHGNMITAGDAFDIFGFEWT